jgi:putative lipoprotein
VFTCDDAYEFVARIEGDRGWLFRPEGTVALPQVPSASGARYSDGSVTFWTKGQEALLDEGGRTHRGCRNHPGRAVWEHAKLGGADFRAVGNEPGWHLEIRQQSRIVLVTDYGASHDEFDLPEPSVDPEARVTRYETARDGLRLTLILRGSPCRDTMSGEAFETAVVVILDGRELRGCGRALH